MKSRTGSNWCFSGQRNLFNAKSSLTLYKQGTSFSKLQLQSAVTESMNISRQISQKNLKTILSNHKKTISDLSNKGMPSSKGKKYNDRYEKIRAEIVKEKLLEIQKNFEYRPQLNLDRAKVSNKQIGSVLCYGANSHPGSTNETNQDRICIITNINRSLLKSKQITFFGIYDGKNGIKKAEFYRDYFHHYLFDNENFQKDIERTTKVSMIKIQKKFKEEYQDNKSQVSFLILILMEKNIILLKSGLTKCFLSENYGEMLYDPIEKKKQKQTYRLGVLHEIKNKQKLDLEFKIMEVKDDLDFIVLGSEGLYQNRNQHQIARKIWLQLLKSETSLHIGLGEAINSLLLQIFKETTNKNISIIVVGFESLKKCLKENDAIQLPFINDLTKMRIDQQSQ